MSSKKYLIAGPPDGELGYIMNKFVELNQKNGPFTAFFVMGGVPTEESDLSSLFDLIKSDFTIHNPVYFVSNKVKAGLLEDSLIEELAQRNIHFVRPFCVMKTSEGLRFACVSGVEKTSNSVLNNDSDSIQFDDGDLKYIEEHFMLSSERDEDEGLLDILFTWSWPHELQSSDINAPVSTYLGPMIWNIKPRYIFCPSHDTNTHFERAPYENLDTKSAELLHTTRFIALSSACDVSKYSNMKKKWIYALNLVPGKFATPMSLSKRPEDCTTNPFLPIVKRSTSPYSETNLSTSVAPNYFFQVLNQEIGAKRQREVDTNPGQLKRPPPGYVCKKCHSGDHFFRDCIYKDSNLNPESKSTYICHICHEPGHNIRNCPKKDERNEDRKKHVVKSVAPDTCWFCLSNPASRKHLIIDIGDEVYLSLAKGPLTPEHLIIIPIEHVSSTIQTPSSEMSVEIFDYFYKINLIFGPTKTSVLFRIASNPTHHLHYQSIAIDAGKTDEFLEFLEDFAIKSGYNFKEVSKDEEIEESFFEFIMASGPGRELKRLVHKFDPSAFFPAQFGRQVLAGFLDMKDGTDWKNQIYTEDDEKKFVQGIKQKLKNRLQ